mgnify:CR=1 FL=1|jgi:hypothetical protein
MRFLITLVSIITLADSCSVDALILCGIWGSTIGGRFDLSKVNVSLS